MPFSSAGEEEPPRCAPWRTLGRRTSCPGHFYDPRKKLRIAPRAASSQPRSFGSLRLPAYTDPRITLRPSAIRASGRRPAHTPQAGPPRRPPSREGPNMRRGPDVPLRMRSPSRCHQWHKHRAHSVCRRIRVRSAPFPSPRESALHEPPTRPSATRVLPPDLSAGLAPFLRLPERPAQTPRRGSPSRVGGAHRVATRSEAESPLRGDRGV